MKSGHFWSGFASGAFAVLAGGLIIERSRRQGASRILRLEKSIQIASPLVDVWEVWSDLDALARISGSIQQVRTFGDRSRWTVNIDGTLMQWEAEITQIIPYQAIAWKSVSGTKHTGRVTFSQLGNDTLVHVTMNYAPPMRLLRPMLSPFAGNIESHIERFLREIKAGLEKRAEKIVASD
jgi:uncharacterized membrane protein